MVDLMTKRLTTQLEGQGLGIEIKQSAKELLAELGVLKPQLSADLARLGARNIPVDVRFEQGKTVLGLK